jgi:hypothetical protein
MVGFWGTRMKKSSFYSLFIVATLMLANACGSTQKGGDHVPTDKTYSVIDLPKGSEARTIVPKEYDSELLARFVHIAENYRVCLVRDKFSDAELAGFQTFLSNNTSGINQYGLEGMINYSFASLQSFDAKKDRFSSRVSIQLVWNDTGSCDLVIDTADAVSFPFNISDFSGKNRVLFGSGQIVTLNFRSSIIPVGYFTRSTIQDDTIHLQKLIASYLGFADAIDKSSYIANGADAASASTWNLVNSGNQILVGDDSLRIYTYAAAWQDILRPRDLDRYHYYGDQLGKGNTVTDPLLTIESVGTVPAFQDLPGNRYLVGARKLQSSVAICFKDDSGLSITKELVSSWTEFTKFSDPYGIHGKLKTANSKFNIEGSVVETGCQLMISFRNESQYPFATNKANGFYAHEGTVKAGDGTASILPIIYVNASNLSLTPEAEGSGVARHIGTVIQHEYAHFLGFRHSDNNSSLQSPAGGGTAWVTTDDAFFSEYLKYWVQ